MLQGDGVEDVPPSHFTVLNKVRFTSPAMIFRPFVSFVDQIDVAVEGDWDVPRLPWEKAIKATTMGKGW